MKNKQLLAVAWLDEQLDNEYEKFKSIDKTKFPKEHGLQYNRYCHVEDYVNLLKEAIRKAEW